MNEREERDSLGSVRVPRDAYYGAHTRRAMDNFPISGSRFHPRLYRELARIKECAVRINAAKGLVTREHAEVIAQAAREVRQERFADQFPVDVFQTGSGTSTNMNMNEVLSTRANELLTGVRRTTRPVHPIDQVNRCQSTNDVFPSAIHIAALGLIRDRALPSLRRLHRELENKSRAFADVKKIGRTHLQDAVVMTLGQEFSGYSAQIGECERRLDGAGDPLRFLALGGTAVGTGMNAAPGFAEETVALLATETGLPLAEAPNHFAAQGGCDAAVEAGGALRTSGSTLVKIADDIRWLASGPRCGLGEISLPALQPGSSIMPGKVNPVLPEAVIQAGTQVLGHDAVLGQCGARGNLELCAMQPLVAHNLLQGLEILANAAELFATGCVRDITANRRHCEENIHRSLAVAAHLTPWIGYDRAADVAQQAWEQNRSVEEVALEWELMAPEQLKTVLYGESGAIPGNAASKRESGEDPRKGE